MNKENQIELIKKERDAHWEKYIELSNKLRELAISDNNLVGKYIYIAEYGFMFVTSQSRSISEYGTDCMYLRGFTFKGSISQYTDDFYICVDALDTWDIPVSTFSNFVKDNEIKVFTKEEFIYKLKVNIDEFVNNFEDMLIKCEQNINE